MGGVQQTGFHARVSAQPAGPPPADMGAAWLLDAKTFHDEFDELFSGLEQPDGLDRFWGRALAVSVDPDPDIRRYLATVEVLPSEQWPSGFSERHLAEWYRVLMAPHLRPTPGLQSPGAVKDRLPDLGWARTDARRLAFGRELYTLAEEYADAPCSAAMSTALPLGTKGWLSQADISGFLDRLPAPADDSVPGNLVPLLDEISRVLGTASAAADRVLLLPPG